MSNSIVLRGYAGAAAGPLRKNIHHRGKQNMTDVPAYIQAPIAGPLQRHEPAMNQASGSSGGEGREAAKLKPVDTSSYAALISLKEAATNALHRIPNNSVDLEKGGLSFIDAKLEAQAFGELVETGKSHFSFAIVTLLFRQLPATALSRGSLTVIAFLRKIREVFVSGDGQKTLRKKLCSPPNLRRYQPLECFYASLAIMSIISSAGVQRFLDGRFGTVFAAVRTVAPRLASLHPVDVVVADDTREILLNIKEDKPATIFALKRRYSPGKENDFFLSVPTAKAAMKRRKSVHDLPEDEGQGPTEPLRSHHFRRNSIAETPVDPEEKVIDSAEPGNIRISFRSLYLSALAGPSKAPDAAKDADLKSLVSEDSGVGSKQTTDDAGGLRRAVQNVILAASMSSKFTPTFAQLPCEAWSTVLGDICVRDPVETCGDAAMHVAMTKALVEHLRSNPEGHIIRKARTDEQLTTFAILGPLLSNCTFLHILLKKGWMSESDAQERPKYPGNALEVYAGALALFKSLEDLVAWVISELKLLYEEAAKGCSREGKSPPSGPSYKRGAERETLSSEKPAKRADARHGEAKRTGNGERRKGRSKTLPSRKKQRPVVNSGRPESAMKLCNDDTSYTFRVPERLAWTPRSDKNDSPEAHSGASGSNTSAAGPSGHDRPGAVFDARAFF
ncbi:hypothetical protein C8R47DRAFT_1073127 [Mycena vitilis]|nr:hypothetical protein C8R47DRAFT_1073127 [Mycena vitilis]